MAAKKRKKAQQPKERVLVAPAAEDASTANEPVINDSFSYVIPKDAVLGVRSCIHARSPAAAGL